MPPSRGTVSSLPRSEPLAPETGHGAPEVRFPAESGPEPAPAPTVPSSHRRTSPFSPPYPAKLSITIWVRVWGTKLNILKMPALHTWLGKSILTI